MKVIWEIVDIVPGTISGKSGNERWMITYDPRSEDPTTQFGQVSLRDGMLSHSNLSRTELADLLNKSNHIPECLQPKVSTNH